MAVLLSGCVGAGPAGPEPGSLDEGAQDVAPRGTAFGEPIDDSIPLTDLAEIVRAPDRYAGRVVRTRGEIARVCQRRGCWMELRDGAEGPAVRVPMAGHSFFVPLDSAGRHATMQGRVAIQELDRDVREHLESEGAVETASALSIEAAGVLID